MAIEVTEVKAYDGRNIIASNQPRAGVVFDVKGLDGLVIQVYDGGDGLSSWPTSLVLTVSASLDDNHYANFPSGAITYTAFGVQASITVTGLSFVRVAVSTVSSAGHGAIGVRANGIAEV